MDYPKPRAVPKMCDECFKSTTEVMLLLVDMLIRVAKNDEIGVLLTQGIIETKFDYIQGLSCNCKTIALGYIRDICVDARDSAMEYAAEQKAING